MSDERRVRRFRHGGNQALRIPREFALDTKEAIIRRDDGRLVMEPTRKIGLLATLAAIPALEEDFPDLDEGMSNMDAIEVWLYRGLHCGLLSGTSGMGLAMGANA